MAATSNWILADLAFAGTVHFARTDAGGGAPSGEAAFPTDMFPTFSDALLGYARQQGIDLRTAGCMLSLPGPAAGDSIRVARSRWTLSRSGLGGMFGGPLLILNDMVATAWSLTGDAGAGVQPLGNGLRPDLTRPGRWAVILLDDGIGGATLTITADGRPIVADTELGHVGFSPANAQEFALMQSLRGYRHAVSWEQVLTRPGAGDTRADLTPWAALAGAFAGDALLATASWSGVILCGHRASALRGGDAYAAFVARGAARAAHGRFIEQAAFGFLPARAPLKGCLAFLRASGRIEPPAPVVPLSPAAARR